VEYDREELALGRLRWADLRTPEWLDPDERPWVPGPRTTGTVTPFEKEIFRKDGSRVPVLMGVATFEAGVDQGAAFVLDLSERKRAEAALERSEQRYRYLLHHTPSPLWRINSGGVILLLEEVRRQGVTDLGSYIDAHPDFLRRVMGAVVVDEVNQATIDVFGARDASDMRAPRSHFWQASPDTFRRILEARYRGEASYQEETRMTTLDGRVIDGLYATSFPDPLNRLGISLSAFVDATDRIRAQEMLRQVQAEFAHAARVSMLGELTASIAHEINQPLAAIAANGEAGLRWLRRPEPDVAELRDLTESIVADARRAGDIIARIRAVVARKTPAYAPLPRCSRIAHSFSR
jgi:PAS domain-containing protein